MNLDETQKKRICNEKHERLKSADFIIIDIYEKLFRSFRLIFVYFVYNV